MQEFNEWMILHPRQHEEDDSDLERFFAAKYGYNYATIASGEVLLHNLPASGDLLKTSEVGNRLPLPDWAKTV